MKDLSVKTKLLVLVIISIVAILVLSVDKIFYGLAAKENIQITKDRILEAEALAKAVHFLQIERGLSVGFIASKGIKNANEILATRKEVDHSIGEIKRVFSLTKGDVSILNSLSQLGQTRTSIDSLSVNTSDTVEFYSKGIKTLLDVTLLIPPLINDKDGRNIIQAYTHLASVKESLGRIRASLNGAFTANKFTDSAFFSFGGSLGAYTINLEKFKVLSSKEMQNFYDTTYRGEVVDKTVAMMQIAKEKGISGDFGVDPIVWFDSATASIDLLRKIELELYKNVYKLADDKIEEANSSLILMISISIAIIIILSVLAFIVIKNITSNISVFQQGLLSFFSFLSRDTSKAQLIDIDSKDEFGTMAKIINENIQKAETQIVMDGKLIEDANDVMVRVENGWYSQLIVATTTNKVLEEFKKTINRMLEKTKDRFITMNKVLEVYAQNDFTKELVLENIERDGVLDTLVKDINKLRSTINQMLQNALQNGIDLQSEAGTLKQAVETLSTASNQQAASLEETAAAMEEMTSNVQNNVAKSNDMALMATQTDSAAKDGAVLAQRTASAMTEIQSATNSINDAVAIIENIAFQTNILSLNAAVEAATAGDAGKGFAVVAQEVRNLANRSADAAKEIKAMASQAAHKSNEGMNIATELTRGFEVIADKIAQTASMVQDVSNANREQMQGIGQINTAVTQLDQMTQENAKVAAQADAIANATISKAEAMVQDALSKEFVGKNNIRTSRTNTSSY